MLRVRVGVRLEIQPLILSMYSGLEIRVTVRVRAKVRVRGSVTVKVTVRVTLACCQRWETVLTGAPASFAVIARV